MEYMENSTSNCNLGAVEKIYLIILCSFAGSNSLGCAFKCDMFGLCAAVYEQNTSAASADSLVLRMLILASWGQGGRTWVHFPST